VCVGFVNKQEMTWWVCKSVDVLGAKALGATGSGLLQGLDKLCTWRGIHESVRGLGFENCGYLGRGGVE
jgi:hypothetical protein